MVPAVAPTIATFLNKEGQKIAYRHWKADQPKGILLIVHGFQSHSGYYQNFASELVENGLGVYAIDLRGRGQSEGLRYYIPDYNAIVVDIAALANLIQSENPMIPLFAMGHSAGGVWASLYAAQYQHQLKGLIAESIALEVPTPKLALNLVKFLSRFVPRLRLVGLRNEDFSRDRQLIEQMNTDPLLANEKQPTRTIQQLDAAAQQLKSLIPKIKIPVLIIHGTADKVTNHSGSEYFVASLCAKDRQLKLYEGHYHDLINDKYNGFIMKDIIRWIDERT
ncbi:lysophospholipase [Flavobacterium sp.]|uniref:alpha/beta hydrolase n=1 Tax=Flavobacterium sp. TaxID=239 RepID=UPI0039E4B3C9